MELNVADLLLGGVPFDYRLSSIRLQLKDGGIEIGPPRSRSDQNGDDDGVANLILQVYNEYAEEVEIEYQPATQQDDTRWGFSCDGRILKTVIPYKFWKPYWYQDLDEEHHHLREVIRRSESAAPRSSHTICSSNACSGEKQPLLSPDTSFLMAGVNICQCRSPNNGNDNSMRQQESSRQVSTLLQPMQVGGLGQIGAAHYSSDAMRVIKVRCQRPPGSPASLEDFERAIKVKCSRPVSPAQVSESETKLRYSRPVSPTQVSETAAKARPLSSTDSSERSVASRSLTPCSTAEALARMQQISDRLNRRPSSSIEFTERLTGSGCTTPCLPTEALARAKDALARVHSIRPGQRPGPSTPKRRMGSRSIANTEVYISAMAAATSPIQYTPLALKKGISIDTSDLMKSFSGDTSDLVDTFSRGTSYCDLDGNKESVSVGQVVVKDVQKLQTRDIWRAAFDKFLSKEKSNLLRHGRRSKIFLKETLDLISKEKTLLLEQGKKYFAAKRKELSLVRLECIFCLRIAPAMVDPEGVMIWNSFNDANKWKNADGESTHDNNPFVTTGTNTVPCTPRNADGQSQT